MDYRKIGFLQLVLIAFLLNIVVQTIHEAGHWAVCETMGRKPVWGFTQLLQIWGDTPPIHPNEWTETTSPDGEKGWFKLGSAPGKKEFSIMLIAGPLASILGVVFGLSLMLWSRFPSTKQMGLLMALISSFVMSQYYLRGFSRMGGDEYFLAANLGIHKYVIDIPLGLAFITGFILCLRALRNWRIILKWLGAIILGSFPCGLLLMKANSIILTQVNEDNPLFRPLFGWSLPVFIVNVLVCFSLWIWWRQANKKQSDSVKTEG